MMRPHCDRCDKLCDDYPSWLEDHRQAVDSDDVGVAAIWHIVIHAGGQVPCEEKMFCRACRIAILEAYVNSLKETK